MPTQSVLILTVPLVVCVNPQLHPWCLPHTFQIPDWKLEEGMRLDSLQWLVACVWPDSNESCTCGRCSALSDELFSGSQCHLICITQDIRYHRTGQPIKPVSMETWKLILTVLPICSVQRQKHACCLLFFCGVNMAIRGIQAPPNSIKSRIPNMPNESVLILTDLLHLWSSIHFCIPEVCLIHSRYQNGNLWSWKILVVHEIGFLTVAGCLCMAGFQWKLNLWKL